MTDHPILTPDLAVIIQDMKLHTDTATAVVLASRVEDYLQAAIQTKMRDDLSSTLIEKLFKGYGPLNSFSGKIDVAYAFSMFGVDIYNDLRAIKDIRNKFAHSKNVIHFESGELAPLLQKLTGWTVQSIPIDLYLERCKSCIAAFEEHLALAVTLEVIKEFKSQHAASPDKSAEPHPHHPNAPDESGAAD
jgi:DNA-binding MltR family transcriptional regulator